ncbi:MAG: SPASM domain-containing protein [Bacteroidales bacterium]|nr:SPASM domain-containing protein [Bacteroidales bacterium]
MSISYRLSVVLRKDLRWGRYIALSVEPSNHCDLSCKECPTGMGSLTRKKGLFDTDAYSELLQKEAKQLLYLNFYFQGEPFLNPNLCRLIREAHRKKIYTSVSTNAQTLTAERAEQVVLSGLDRIIISIDGTSQDVYEKYRVGGSLQKVIDATKYLVTSKRKQGSLLQIVFQMVVFSHNEHQIQDLISLAKTIGVDKVDLKSAQIYNFQEKRDMIPINKKWSRYIEEGGLVKIKNPLKHRCWRMWHSAVVTQDLNVVPCCYDKDAEFKLGNLKEVSLKDIQKSIQFKNFRESIALKRSSIEMCKNCDEGLKL